jgi:hypothetical protein
MCVKRWEIDAGPARSALWGLGAQGPHAGPDTWRARGDRVEMTVSEIAMLGA